MTVHIIELTDWGRANPDVSPRPWDGGRWGEIWDDGALSDGYPYLIGSFHEKVQDEGGQDELRWFECCYDNRNFSSGELTLESVESAMRFLHMLGNGDKAYIWTEEAESDYLDAFRDGYVADYVWKGARLNDPHDAATAYDEKCISYLVGEIKRFNAFFDGNDYVYLPGCLQHSYDELIDDALDNPDAPEDLSGWWLSDAVHQPIMRDWYRRAYPDDAIAEDMSEGATFSDLQDALESGRDVYEVMGGGDSLVRERVFEHLAELQGGNQETIHGRWVSDAGGKEER